MPVWHEQTRELVAAGELRVIGLTQEQHPDRCQLYAQWKGYDFPILWDPFNLTKSAAVPIVMAVDGTGVIREMRLDMRKGRAAIEEFLGQTWPAQVTEPAQPYPTVTSEAAMSETHPRNPASAAQYGIARLLFHRPGHGAPPTEAVFETSLSKVGGYAHFEGSPASARYHLGVAHRLRYDSAHRQGTDFQASLDAWMAALIENPAQYIWRRRIQQWGPRLDKPYPFYDWVAEAQRDVRARGEEPIAVAVPLTGAEVAGGTREIPGREHEDVHPDPGGKIPRDGDGLVTLETAAALHTGIVSKGAAKAAGTARVHLVLRPNTEQEVHWGNEAGPTQVWVEVPEGWGLRRNLWSLPLPEDKPESSEVRTLDFEVHPPAGSPATGPIRGLALYPVCLGSSGECRFLAQEFEVTLPVPSSSSDR